MVRWQVSQGWRGAGKFWSPITDSTEWGGWGQRLEGGFMWIREAGIGDLRDSLKRNRTEDGKTQFRWLAFVVSHPSDKDKDVLPRGRPDGAPAVSSPVGWQSRWVTQKRFKIGSSQGIERGFCTGLDGEIGGMTAAMARRMVFSRARRAWGRGNPGRLTRRMVREDGITTYSRRTTGSVPGAFSIFASFKARLIRVCLIFSW